MEFIKLNNDRYLIKDSNNIVVSNEERLELEKGVLILKDIEGCGCQAETTKRISEINEELENVKHNSIKKATRTTKGHSKSE